MSEWRKCTTCKESIAFQSKFWICNVSTCQKKRAGLIFCSVECWDAHVPTLRHKDSWAIERRAPTEAEWKFVLSGAKIDPTYPEREKKPAPEPEAPRRDPNAKPKTILRKKSQLA